MVSSREGSRPTRRRIAGERSRPAGPQTAAGEPEAPASDIRAPREPTHLRLVEAADAAEDAAAAEDLGRTADRAPADAQAPPTAQTPTAQTPEAQEAPADETAAPEAPDAAPAEEPAGGAAWATRDDRAGEPPTWVLTALAALLVAALAVDGLLLWKQQQDQEEAERALHSAVTVAPSVAERAAEAVLSYRYNTLGKDVAEARQYLSEDYRPDYVSSIRDVVATPASEIGAVVQAQVLASGVVEASGERASVLLFVDQTTTSAADTQSRTALNRVVFTMVPRDGTWKVDEIQAF